MNKITLTGNLVRDVEYTQLDSGKKVAKFDIAVKRDFKNKEGEYPVDFFRVISWNGLAEVVAKYLSKGRKALVNGAMYTRDYVSSEDGIKRRLYEVIADEVEFLSPPKDKDKEEMETAKTPPKKAKAKSISELEPVEDDGNLPF